MSSIRPDLKFSDHLDEKQYYNKYFKLPPKGKDTIRVIDHKDYFTVLDEDADLIADNIYKTQSVIKYNKSQRNRYATISPQVFANNVLKFCLIDNNHKIEVYNSKTFQLIAMGTPGNLEAISDEYGVNLEGLFQDCSSPITAAIKFQQQGATKKIGICLIDLSNLTIQVSEFDDNDLFSNLESLLIQLGVKEVILPSNYDPENKELPDILKLYQILDKVGNIVISTVKSSYFTIKDIEQDLLKLLSKEDTNIELILGAKGINSNEFPLSFSCCNALINYLELLNENNDNVFSIDKYSLSKFMKLDSSTLNALNIFPNKQANNFNVKSNQISSMFELLNKCKTGSGSRLLSQWLKQPLTNYTAITERQQLVEKLIDDTSLRVFVSQEFLSKVPDIKRLLKKLNNNVKKTSGNENKKLEDVVRLYQIVLILPNLIDILKLTKEDDEESEICKLIKNYWLGPISNNYSKLVKFQELVETTIDLSPLESNNVHDLINTDFNIKPEFDESLVEINDKLQNTLKQIQQEHEKVSDDLNMEVDKKLKLENHQTHSWCFRVTRNDSSVLRNTSYTELQTVKAGVYFTNKQLRHLSLEYQNTLQEYNSKQKTLIKEILSISLTYELVFMELSISLSHLDVITSFANVSILSPTQFVKPSLIPLCDQLDDSNFSNRKIDLKNSRHPILEVQDDLNFIPNDVNLSNSDKSFALITGPNMGGKSTYIRQIGVIALMSQIGCFIPSDEPATLPIFDSILSRVGAGDSQLKGLSTFMIEMLETSSILSNASHNSLIIIDELGRGTSTYDGFGLAYAILEHIIKQKQCFTLFATHFHELTELSNKFDKVKNLQVQALIGETEDLTLVYKVEPGISSKSFGINVAELVKFPEKIVNMAKRKASELQQEENNDDYIKIKKTKCSNDEINTGIDNLNNILVKWKQQCFDKTNKKLKLGTDETIEKLKEISKLENTNDKFLNEVMALL